MSGRPRELKPRKLTEFHEGVTVTDSARFNFDADLPGSRLGHLSLLEHEGTVRFSHDHCFHFRRLPMRL